MKKRLSAAAAVLLFLLTVAVAVHAQDGQPKVTVATNPMKVNPAAYLDRIVLPPGFTISIYADGVEGARSLALGKSGTLFVGTNADFGKPPIGKVYAVVDSDGDHKADKVYTVARGLNYPNGVAFRDGALYIAELSRILRLDDIENHLADPPGLAVVNDSFPADYHHGWKFIRFGPDGKLYVPVGAPCNICEPDSQHAAIFRINPDGSGKEVFARGIRNSVGFDWDPETKAMWFTDNGRDLWGDDRPPEELNRAPRAGLHFGFPYRYGKSLVDDTYKTTMTDADFTPAELEMPAHTAALGIRFYSGASFPAEYKNQLFIAHHGSWNRDPPQGYRIGLAHIKDGHATGYEVFASGWLTRDHKYWGRPVDIEFLPDGSMLVSDDFNGVIYRIAYKE